MTESPQEFAAWVQVFITVNGYSPTLREAADAFDIAASTMLLRCRRWRAEGIVRFEDSHARTLRAA